MRLPPIIRSTRPTTHTVRFTPLDTSPQEVFHKEQPTRLINVCEGDGSSSSFSSDHLFQEVRAFPHDTSGDWPLLAATFRTINSDEKRWSFHYSIVPEFSWNLFGLNVVCSIASQVVGHSRRVPVAVCPRCLCGLVHSATEVALPKQTEQDPHVPEPQVWENIGTLATAEWHRSRPWIIGNARDTHTHTRVQRDAVFFFSLTYGAKREFRVYRDVKYENDACKMLE